MLSTSKIPTVFILIILSMIGLLSCDDSLLSKYEKKVREYEKKDLYVISKYFNEEEQSCYIIFSNDSGVYIDRLSGEPESIIEPKTKLNFIEFETYFSEDGTLITKSRVQEEEYRRKTNIEIFDLKEPHKATSFKDKALIISWGESKYLVPIEQKNNIYLINESEGVFDDYGQIKYTTYANLTTYPLGFNYEFKSRCAALTFSQGGCDRFSCHCLISYDGKITTPSHIYIMDEVLPITALGTASMDKLLEKLESKIIAEYCPEEKSPLDYYRMTYKSNGELNTGAWKIGYLDDGFGANDKSNPYLAINISENDNKPNKRSLDITILKDRIELNASNKYGWINFRITELKAKMENSGDIYSFDVNSYHNDYSSERAVFNIRKDSDIKKFIKMLGEGDFRLSVKTKDNWGVDRYMFETKGKTKYFFESLSIFISRVED